MRFSVFRLLLVLLVTLFISGCEKVNICHDGVGICKPSAGAGIIPPSVEVVELSAAEKNCSCGAAKQFLIRNTGGSAPGVTWTTHSREPADTNFRSVETTRTLLRNESVKLPCTIEPTATLQCLRSNVAIFRGVSYGGDADTILNGIVATSARASLESMERLPDAMNNCPQKCRGSGSDCLRVNAKERGSVDVARKIALVLGNHPSVITNKYIAEELTASKSNVCQRSNFVFEDGQAYNIGLLDRCEIEAVLPGPVLGDFAIAVPRTMSFQHVPRQDSNFLLQFRHLQAAPELRFTNATLQEVYGGHVLAVAYDSGSFVIELENTHRCLAVQIN